MRRLFLILGILILLAVLAAGAGWLELQKRLSPAAAESRPAMVSIPKGATVPEIGMILEKAGVVRSADLFRYYVAWHKLGPGLKAGEHMLDANMSTPEVADSLIKGKFKLYSLTVPEGLTMVQVADLAGQSGLADRDQFLAFCRDPEFIRSVGLDTESLEGYLFPETYSFVRGTSTQDVVRAMVDGFRAVWGKYEGKAASSGMTRHEIVTLASIVEKETGADFERPLIAAVFLNRLKRGMRLETDPTVIYGIRDFDGNLTRRHLETPTPYNTYLIPGLPPGPIANPGENSIRAVLEPADSPYLFFVSKNDGTHHFSTSLTEHNRAVNRYQRRR